MTFSGKDLERNPANIASLKFLLFNIALLAALSACGSVKSPESMTVDEVYAEAMILFKNEDYLESKRFFEVIKLQYPASQYADDAHYYISEISLLREEYILAAFSYNYLRRVYPSSDYARLSLFKTGLCYYKLSPRHDLDQEYSKKAISTFLEFLLLYPKDTLKTEIEGYIKELRNRLAEREYRVAELYRKLDSPSASVVYYDFVISEYDDTDFFELSYFGKIECFIQMKKNDEAAQLISLYKRKFQNGKFLKDVERFERDLNK